jgi:hypothetical protein
MSRCSQKPCQQKGYKQKYMKQQQDFGNRGYAMVVLLVFVIMAVVLISAAVNIMLVVTQSASQGELSQNSLSLAEMGVEEALIRIVRDPSYTGGIITVGSDQIDVGVIGEGGSTKTITSSASISAVSRSVVVNADIGVSSLSIPSWVVQY